MTTSRQDKADATDDELLRLARKCDGTDQVECAEDQYAIGVYVEHTRDPLLLLHTASQRRRAALHAALLVLAGEVDLQAVLGARDELGESYEDGFQAGLRSALAVLVAKQHDWCSLAKDARSFEADGSVDAIERAVLDAAENAVSEGCDAINALLDARAAPAEGAGK